ncbi:uncharacterized protein LOC110845122 [Folsomia candida]|uniref:Uncharacterized protein n=1 Tax=Folsomia candida TaxID=158441 RepID=A0A226EVF9_FOLCA|nr:uncharacterized protein LOC110845122 [Folsomia candida]OXA60586.1 hypothetical protein Fcan01_04488 [Folsomia candida]
MLAPCLRVGGATAALLVGGAEGGIFHRITMTSMTSAWYLTIGKFEAIIVGLLILEIFVLRYLLILPLDYTKWIEQGILLQTAVSKRKRKKRFLNSVSENDFDENVKLIDSMLTVVRRLDENDCLLKALCELESLQRSNCYSLPPQVVGTLAMLKKLDENPQEKSSQIMPLYQEAVRNGANATGFSSCDIFYSKCGLTSEEITTQLQLYFSVLSNS